MEAPAGLETIKYEKRLAFFTKRFGKEIPKEKENISKGGALSPAFLCESITSMMVYTCQDLQDHNEVVIPEDVRRISCYYFIELIKKVFGIDLETEQGWVGVSHLSMLYYTMLVTTRSQMGVYNIDYLINQNKIIEEEKRQKQLEAAAAAAAGSLYKNQNVLTESAKLDKIATTAIDTTNQVTSELMEMSNTEMIKPVATNKTRSRLSNLMTFGRNKKDKEKEKIVANLKNNLPTAELQRSINIVSPNTYAVVNSQDVGNNELI
jgi:hypothetical protein